MANENQIRGNIGMYYVCMRMSEEGLNVMPTSRNAKGIDIVAYGTSGKFTTVQVKSFRKPCAVPLGKDLENLCGDYWCVVYQNKDSGYTTFVMTLVEVKERAHKDSKGSYWMEYKTFRDCAPFKDNFSRITDAVNNLTPSKQSDR